MKNFILPHAFVDKYLYFSLTPRHLLCSVTLHAHVGGMALSLHSAGNWLLFLLPQVGLDRDETVDAASTIRSFCCCSISLDVPGFPCYEFGCTAGEAANAFHCEDSHLAELRTSVLHDLASLKSLLHCFETALRPTKWKFPHHFQPRQRAC